MRWLLTILVFAVTAVLAHYAVLGAIPGRIMSMTQARMAERGTPMNKWIASARMTPQTQTVVRPSPDLSYAICRFDTSDGPVLLSAPTAETYGSLSIFDSRTNNVFVASLTKASQFEAVIVHPPGEPPMDDGRDFAASGRDTLELQGPGLALIRRLAPDQETHDLARELASESRCEKIP